MQKLLDAISYHQKAARGCFKNAERYRENRYFWLAEVYQEAAYQNSRRARLLLFYLLKKEHAKHARTKATSSL